MFDQRLKHFTFPIGFLYWRHIDRLTTNCPDSVILAMHSINLLDFLDFKQKMCFYLINWYHDSSFLSLLYFLIVTISNSNSGRIKINFHYWLSLYIVKYFLKQFYEFHSIFFKFFKKYSLSQYFTKNSFTD